MEEKNADTMKVICLNFESQNVYFENAPSNWFLKILKNHQFHDQFLIYFILYREREREREL